MLPELGWIVVLNSRKVLHQSRRRVARLGDGKPLSRTDTGAAVEGQVFPAWPKFLPSLGVEVVGIGAKEFLASVHHKGAVRDDVVLLEEERRFAVRSSTVRDGDIFVRHAAVGRDRREEAEGFLDHVAEVGHALKGFVCHWLLPALEDFGSEFLPHVRSPGEREEDEAEQASGGITGRQKHVDNLIAEHDGIIAVLSKFVQEDVLLARSVGFVVFQVEFPAADIECLLYKLISECMYSCTGFREFLVVMGPHDLSQPEAKDGALLSIVQRIVEGMCGV